MLTWKNILQLGDATGSVSGSVFWSNIIFKPSDLVSSSVQVKRFLPPNTVSSSAQVVKNVDNKSVLYVLNNDITGSPAQLNFDPSTRKLIVSGSSTVDSGIIINNRHRNSSFAILGLTSSFTMRRSGSAGWTHQVNGEGGSGDPTYRLIVDDLSTEYHIKYQNASTPGFRFVPSTGNLDVLGRIKMMSGSGNVGYVITAIDGQGTFGWRPASGSGGSDTASYVHWDNIDAIPSGLLSSSAQIASDISGSQYWKPTGSTAIYYGGNVEVSGGNIQSNYTGLNAFTHTYPDGKTIYMGAGSSAGQIVSDGALILIAAAGQAIQIGDGTYLFSYAAAQYISIIRSYVEDSAASIGFVLRNNNALTTAGAKLLSVQNVFTEVASIDKDGDTWISGSLGIDVASPTAKLELKSNASDYATKAVILKAADGGRLATITSDGRAFFGGDSGHNVALSANQSGKFTGGVYTFHVGDSNGNLYFSSNAMVTDDSDFSFGSNNFGSALIFESPANNGMIRVAGRNTTIGQQSLGGTPDKTLRVYNASASGVTSFRVQEGVWQSGSEVLGIYANNDTTARFIVFGGGNIKLGNYTSSRNDSFTPVNFLYTDTTGSLKSKPLSAISVVSSSYAATASYVRKYSNVSGLPTKTLDIRQASRYFYTGSVNTVWTLPSIAGNTDVEFWIKNRGSGSINLVASGTNRLYDFKVTPSMSIYTGEAYVFYNDGTYWNVF